ncbi:hypothetical protein T265_13429, partial [Opisthorchis viverrini]
MCNSRRQLIKSRGNICFHLGFARRGIFESIVIHRSSGHAPRLTEKNELLCAANRKAIQKQGLLIPGRYWKKSFRFDILSVPSCHAIRRKHEGKVTARLPKPRQGKSRGIVCVQITDLP